jgi:hypothetical protein
LPFPIDSGIDEMEYEETLRNLDKVDFGKLRTKFREKVKSIYDDILTKSKPKSMNKIALSAEAFSKYIEKVVESLNNNQEISIMDCWVSSLKFIFEQDLKNALDDHKKKLDAELNTPIPLDWKIFEEKAKSVAEISKNIFMLALGSEHGLTKPFIEEFDKNVVELHEIKKNEHKEKIKKSNEQASSSDISTALGAGAVGIGGAAVLGYLVLNALK